VSRASLDSSPATPSRDDKRWFDGIIEELTWEQVEKARHAADRNSPGADELVEVMQMLGIYPGQDNPAKIVNAPDPRSVPTHVR
jgi:hypothetical protein